MKIEVDQTRCRTIGICVRELPEVFAFQEGSKKATVVLDEIPLCLYGKCREVAAACPQQAITIKE